MKGGDIIISLLRGINVGGKNKVSMAELRKCLEELGFFGVSTFIASGNVILTSDRNAHEIAAQIEAALPKGRSRLCIGFLHECKSYRWL